MNRTVLKLALLVSLAINLGVLGAVAWRQLVPAGQFAGQGSAQGGLPEYLGLDDRQLGRWREAEHAFLAGLAESSSAIAGHRERMIREIFSQAPDLVAIESERASIARLQESQQRLVIEQLLAERSVLDPGQRAKLAEVLLSQPAASATFERLHRE
jgi:Spy/CpxP family protein refolding chaperone